MAAAHPLLIAVMGETASGKTDLAEGLAAELDAQLVNADSFQTYRGMDIGTAKSEQKALYKLLDIKDPDEPFGVGEWVQRASAVLTDVYEQQRSAVVVGGSGLNIRALFEQYADMASAPDPELREALNQTLAEEGLAHLVKKLQAIAPQVAARTDLMNPVRVIRALERVKTATEVIRVQLPPFTQVKFAIRTPVEQINGRILIRVRQMLASGWLEEVDALRQAGYGPNAPGFRAHGYRELWRVLQGELGLDEAVDSIVAQVRRYAKRQRTWSRTEPNLTVLDSEGEAKPVTQALAHLFALGEGGT
ncbi:MAG: tRNA dimethylallyltransferase [Fimbriimonadaceae bacterium]|jgi:tRNA dimethylallyltransferase|nr:tRNA dimethylallyltransferase [Fimbriimonadaceae bacterium]